MAKPDYPVTPAVRFLRAHGIAFTPHCYDYIERGGAAHSAACLNVDEYCVIKTIVLQNQDKQGLMMLMHGNREISTRNLARQIGMKHIETADPKQAAKWTGYLVGGTSPFGTKTALPVYAQNSIFELPLIYINGGKRGFLVSLSPKALGCLNVKPVDAATD